VPIWKVINSGIVALVEIKEDKTFVNSPISNPPETSPPIRTWVFLSKISFKFVLVAPGMHPGCLSITMAFPIIRSNPCSVASSSFSPTPQRAKSLITVENTPITPFCFVSNFFKFEPAILASHVAIDASFNFVGLLVKNEIFSAQSPAANMFSSLYRNLSFFHLRVPLLGQFVRR